MLSLQRGMGLIVRDFQQGLVKAVRKKNSAFLSVKVFSSKVLIDSYWRWERHFYDVI